MGGGGLQPALTKISSKVGSGTAEFWFFKSIYGGELTFFFLNVEGGGYSECW